MLKHLISITINQIKVFINPNMSVLEACKFVGFRVARFCYHSMLSVAGNCRMCLVELTGSLKPIASCALPITNGMVIYLDSPLVQKARENVMEALLLNHPLDCPICDQGGECDLQDQSKKFGVEKSRNLFVRRAVSDKFISPLILTIMTRCIHCTRCVRFSAEVLGTEILGALNRGGRSEIGNYSNSLLLSELSGNVVDLCPVGALTSKQYNFRARPWELRSVESIDLTDSLGSNTFVNFQYGNIVRVIPKFNKDINGSVITDSARFFIDSLASRRLYKNYSCNVKESFYTNVHNILHGHKTLCLIDEFLDLESCFILTMMAYRFGCKIRSVKLSSVISSNLYISGAEPKVSSLAAEGNLTIVMASNLKIENSIINYKIRQKYTLENTKIYTLAGYNETNYSAYFINLSSQGILKLLEGKSNFMSKKFFSNKPVHIIIGESFLNRGISVDNLKANLTSLCQFLKVTYISSKCNTNGLMAAGIKSVNKKLTTKQVTIQRIAVNLNETLFLYNLLATNNTTTFWLDTHGPSYLGKFASNLVPIMPNIISGGMFMNLEKRTQLLANVPFKSHLSKNILSTKGIFSLLLGSENLYNSKYINTLKLLSIATQAFQQHTPWFSYLNTGVSVDKVSTYPFKNYIEDSIFSSKQTLFSKALTIKSIKIRENFNKFL
jgi:NADH-quinone oxidoreductase subunit G